MDPARWQKVDHILEAAIELPSGERAAFLAVACAGDEHLQAELESLLAAHDERDTFLERRDPERVMKLLAGLAAAGPCSDPCSMETGRSSRTGAPPTAQNDSFEPYVPVRVLGEGGMGTVYLARQRQPIRREVALKVVKAGIGSRQVIERFEIERQTLALMDHPNVARVFDAGTSGRGHPYFVMEYVDGIPITRYCDEHVLGTRERLELFVMVCNALEHAHRKGIIHRDVKPSNILVTRVDGKPIPKVIDFGIARATDALVTELGAFTVSGQIIGTPEYMSPEQADLDCRDIDASTDVYSLGTVLYELLVGALPLDLHLHRKLGFAELLRAVRELPVPRPSTRLSQMGAAEEVASKRGTDGRQLKRNLSGDLDWIVMKAIEKDRSCRYASAAELAGDIARYLKNEPVLAGPPGVAYRTRKFVVRNKGPVATAAIVVSVLIGGLIMTAWQARVATLERAEAIHEKAEADRQRALAERQAIESVRQRDAAQRASERAVVAERRAKQERNAALTEKQRANREAAIARAVNDFLQKDVLAQASPDSQARPGAQADPDLKVRTAVDRAAARIAARFHGQPLVEASIRLTLGETYRELGQYPEAQREVLRAVELRRQALGEQQPGTLEAKDVLGMLYMQEGKYSQSESLFSEVLAGEQRLWGPEHPKVVAVKGHLAELYQRQGKYAQAEPLLSNLLELQGRILGPTHSETLMAMNNLAMLYRSEGKYGQAEPLLLKSLQIKRRVLGEEHSATLMAMVNLAALYRSERRYTEAEPILTKALETYHRVQGDEYPDAVAAMSGLGALYFVQGKYAQAEAIAVNLVEVNRRVLGAEHPDTLTDMNNLALLYVRQGKYADAEPLVTKVLEARRRVLGEEHPSTLNAMQTLGGLYLSEGKEAEAAPILTRALEMRRRALGSQHPDTTSTMISLAGLRLQQGKYAEAESLLHEAFDNFQKVPDRWERYLVESRLGGSLTSLQKYAQAEPFLLSGYAGMVQRQKAIPKDRAFEIKYAGDRIIQLYREWGKPEKASEWEAKLNPK